MDNSLNIKNIVLNLSDENNKKLKEYNKTFIKYHVLNEEEITKAVQIEKMYDYLEIANQSIKNKEIKNIFMTKIISILRGGIKFKSRADKYLDRLREIRKKSREKLSESDYKSFARVFICMYDSIIQNEKKIEDFDLFIENVDYEKIRENLLNSPIKNNPFDKVIPKNNEFDKYDEISIVVFILDFLYLDILQGVEDMKGDD